MSTTTLLYAVAAVAAIALIALTGGRLPDSYNRRKCQGTAWRRAFPAAPKSEIRGFLSTFVDAFALRDKDKLKLRPDDDILSIYRAFYPYPWIADSLELETLAKHMKSRYGVDLASLWRDDMTLGQLFAQARQPA